MPENLIALILGIVEGLTEFVPVSSTGHLIIVGHLLGFTGERAATFEVFIQLGAILAVVVLYRRRFLDLFRFRQTSGFYGWRALGLLALTTLPVLVVGALARDVIKNDLFNPFTVAIGLAAGGLAILLVEGSLPPSRVEEIGGLTWREALLIGLFQCFALWPGVSRAAATILGGMLVGLRRKAAAEYSFLVAVPALFAAGLYDLARSLSFLSASDVLLFAIGFAAAFGSALLAIQFFIRLLGTGTLRPFGWYRLVLALAVIPLTVRW